LFRTLPVEVKAQSNLKEHGTLGPLSTPVVARKKKEQYVLDVQSSTGKKLAKTQER